MWASRLGWYSVSDANPAQPCCLCHHVTIGQNSYRHERLPWWQCSQSISSHWYITMLEVMLCLEYCTHLQYIVYLSRTRGHHYPLCIALISVSINTRQLRGIEIETQSEHWVWSEPILDFYLFYFILSMEMQHAYAYFIFSVYLFPQHTWSTYSLTKTYHTHTHCLDWLQCTIN